MIDPAVSQLTGESSNTTSSDQTNANFLALATAPNANMPAHIVEQLAKIKEQIGVLQAGIDTLRREIRNLDLDIAKERDRTKEIREELGFAYARLQRAKDEGASPADLAKAQGEVDLLVRLVKLSDDKIAAIELQKAAKEKEIQELQKQIDALEKQGWAIISQWLSTIPVNPNQQTQEVQP